jgi:hypothetical protein
VEDAGTMKLYAVVRLGSTIDRVWRNRGDRDGSINGVAFRLMGRLYETDELDRDQMNAIRKHECVEIRGTSIRPRRGSLGTLSML